MTDSVFFLFWDPYSPTLTKEGVWGCSLQQTAKEVESAKQSFLPLVGRAVFLQR